MEFELHPCKKIFVQGVCLPHLAAPKCAYEMDLHVLQQNLAAHHCTFMIAYDSWSFIRDFRGLKQNFCILLIFFPNFSIFNTIKIKNISSRFQKFLKFGRYINYVSVELRTKFQVKTPKIEDFRGGVTFQTY